MRGKRAALVQALTGRFNDHHAELARMLLDQIEALGVHIDRLTSRIQELIGAIPAAQPPRKRPTTPARTPTSRRCRAGCRRSIAWTGSAASASRPPRCSSPRSDWTWVSSLLPHTWCRGPGCPPHHPVRHQAARRRHRQGQPYLKGVPGEAAAAAAKTDTFLGERYRRLVKRRGKLKALVAVARSILVIVWHLLADPTARYHDLGSDFYTSRIDTDPKTRTHIRQLQALGFTVTLTPAA
jgi:transposase